MSEILLRETDDRGVATVTLNRPEVHNAFNGELIGALHDAFGAIREDKSIRVVILTGAGKSFSAGADLNYMKQMSTFSEKDNIADALKMATMFDVLNTLPQPVVAKVNGAAIAGATGLIASSDVAIAADTAKFGISEVRIGLIPAAISPYVMKAIGPRHARRYFLTAERFDAATALRIGLVHESVPAGDLDARVEEVVDALLMNGPDALSACKTLIRDIGGPVSAKTRQNTAERIARIRVTPEGQEGVGSFLEKRKPNWQIA